MSVVKYPSLLPKSSTRLEFDLEQTAYFANDFGSFNFTDIHDPYKCPAALLSWLAWERHVDVFDEAWPISKKREVIAGSPMVHIRKGTRESIRKAIRDAGYGEIEIIEGGTPIYHDGVWRHDSQIYYGAGLGGHWAQYKIIMERQLSFRQYEIVKKILNEVTPARCQLIGIQYKTVRLHDSTFNHNGEYSYGVN